MEKLKSELNAVLSVLDQFEDNARIIDAHFSIFCVVKGRSNEFEYVGFGQDPDTYLGENRWLGPKAVDHFITINGNKVRFSETLQTLRDVINEEIRSKTV